MSHEALEHFKNLLKIDTSNPPGNEMEAIKYLKDVLVREGFEPVIHETAPNRGNLVVRIKGSGEKKPLLVHSHVDVVRAEPEKWKFPPFSAAEHDGWVYGRGAIDMKNFTAMCLMTVLTAKRESWRPKRDIIMAAVSDEETGSQKGMAALVRERPELVTAEYAIGEVGGATNYIGEKPFYPIQAGEKGVFWIEVKFGGEPGHGSLPRAENVHWRLTKFLSALAEKPMPGHMTKTYRAFLEGASQLVGWPAAAQFELLKTPLASFILKKKSMLGGESAGRAATMHAMLTNTVNPTGITSGYQHNVVPSSCTLKLDCRVIPGISPEQVIAEIEALTDEKINYTVVNSQAGHESPLDSELYNLICKKVEAHHPGAKALPILTTGFTDAAQLQKLGVKCYGFVPTKLPSDVSFTELYHGHNERIPVEGFKWGTQVFIETVKEFCC